MDKFVTGPTKKRTLRSGDIYLNSLEQKANNKDNGPPEAEMLYRRRILASMAALTSAQVSVYGIGLVSFFNLVYNIVSL